MHRHRGFSLIEIIVALAIAAAVAAVITPRFSSAIRTAEIKAAARETAAIMNTARVHAVGAAGETSLLINIDDHTISLGDSEILYRYPKKLALTVTAAESEQISEGIVGIRFFADGSSTGGRVELSYPGKGSYIVDVDWLTGATRILN